MPTLGEVCESPQYGWTTRAAQSGALKLLRTTDISSGTIDWARVPYCAQVPPDVEKFRLRADDIVIARSGSVGVSCLVQDPPPAVFASYLVRFRPRVGVDPAYLAHCLKAPEYWAQVRAAVSGIAMPNVNAKKLSAISVPVPDGDAQRDAVRRIDNALSQVDAGDRAARAALARIPLARRALLGYAFDGQLVALAVASSEDGHQLLERIREVRAGRPTRGRTGPLEPSSTSGLPSAWASARWSEVGDSQNGRPFPSREYTSRGIKLLRPGNLHASGRVEWTDENTRWLPEAWAERVPDLLIGENEIVMNLTAQSLKDEFLGRTCMTGPGERCLLNQRLARLTPTLLDARYVYWVFRSPRFRAFVRTLNKGSLIQHMFTSQVATFELPIPPLQEQQRIAAELDARLSVLEHVELTLRRALGKLDRLTDAVRSHALRVAAS